MVVSRTSMKVGITTATATSQGLTDSRQRSIIDRHGVMTASPVRMTGFGSRPSVVGAVVERPWLVRLQDFPRIRPGWFLVDMNSRRHR